MSRVRIRVSKRNPVSYRYYRFIHNFCMDVLFFLLRVIVHITEAYKSALNGVLFGFSPSVVSMCRRQVFLASYGCFSVPMSN